MAERLVRVCDVCGKDAGKEAVKFGWNLAHYEADLCKDHFGELSGLLEAIIPGARRLGSKAPVTPKPERRPRVNPVDVRAWAKKRSIEVNSSGRIPESIVEQYLAEQVPSA